jgi:hypothetical protein
MINATMTIFNRIKFGKLQLSTTTFDIDTLFSDVGAIGNLAD